MKRQTGSSCEESHAFLDIPLPELGGNVDTRRVLETESALGDTGIVMIDTPDPLCLAASLFDMAEYTIIAMTEQALFHELLERFAATLLAKTADVAKALPGRLWRIYGPEYASPPYLPPALFRCRKGEARRGGGDFWEWSWLRLDALSMSLRQGTLSIDHEELREDD